MEKHTEQRSRPEWDRSDGSEKQLDGDGKLRVIIIGGSIAGLSCAHAFLKSGVCSSVVVLEKANSLSAAGAGLGIDERSCQALEEWGLRDDLLRQTKPLNTEQNRAIDKEGGVCTILSRDEEFCHQAVHWSDLHRILYDSLPSGIARYGHEVISLEENKDHSSIRTIHQIWERNSSEETVIRPL